MPSANQPAIDLYVYYRVRVLDEEQFKALARKFLDEVHAEHGVAGSISRRPEAGDELHTWMEVFSSVDAGFEEALAGKVNRSGLGALIRGPRHAERFVRIF